MFLALNAFKRLEGLLVSVAEETQKDAFAPSLALQLEIMDMIPAECVVPLEEIIFEGEQGPLPASVVQGARSFASIMISARCCDCWVICCCLLAKPFCLFPKAK
jgi:hypothetical protein